MSRSAVTISFIIAATILPTRVALAGQQADRISIKPQSSNAAILIKSPSLPIPPNYRTAYRLLFQLYDPVTQRILGGGFTLAAEPKLMMGGFLAADIKPGTYALTGFSRQDFWELCYQDATIQFTIRPGEVLYLGEFDARLALRDLTAKAVGSGRTATKNNKPVDFFDAVPPPPFRPVTPYGLTQASAFVQQSMPGTTVAPTVGDLTPAKFGTGSTLFGERRCGGYFQVKAK